MARFEHRGRRDSGRDSRGGFRGRDSRGRDSRRGRASSRDSGRGRDGPRSSSRNRRDFERTQVVCDECGKSCEVPFKPSSDKPIYCDDCFGKKGGRGGSSNGGISGKDLEVINEKLDKIMKALNVE